MILKDNILEDNASKKNALKNKFMNIVYVQLLYLFFSLGNIASKIAAKYEFLSLRYFLLYGLVLGIMVLFSFFWQKILKRVPLVLAYSNRGTLVIWSLLWSALIFKEKITAFNMLGALIIILGIVMVAQNE